VMKIQKSSSAWSKWPTNYTMLKVAPADFTMRGFHDNKSEA